jgi:hypothetical protein
MIFEQVRCMLFALCCLVWVYTVGMHHMISVLADSASIPVVNVPVVSKTHSQHGRRSSSTTVVQSAHPCR